VETLRPAPGAQEAVLKAVAQFNAGEFWECHETLEDFWGDEQGPLRDFYHGVIQVAAGFVHVQRRNWYGAVRLLGEGAEKLEPFRPVCLRVQVEPLLIEVVAWRRRLAALGPERMADVAGLALPKIDLSEGGG
jgi:predicted metal-dependent hydrolase